MSGPVDASVAADTAAAGAPVPAATEVVEVTDGRHALVGDMAVRRVLPRRQRRTVGAWCFADVMGPAAVTRDRGIDIGPHPHIGLHTVTWLLAGEVLHRDSLGSEQVIRPGQLNLMTAGRGVAHSEEATGSYAGPLHGVQLWVAQPEATRHDGPAFEHHADLPRIEIGRSDATVLVGAFAGAVSPARADTPLVGADVAVRAGETTWPLREDFEHAVIVLTGGVNVAGQPVGPGQLAYLGDGRDHLALTTDDDARLLLLGGEPFAEPVLMWWNYVARDRDEIDAAAQEWNAGGDRFGHVASPLARIPSPVPLWAT